MVAVSQSICLTILHFPSYNSGKFMKNHIDIDIVDIILSILYSDLKLKLIHRPSSTRHTIAVAAAGLPFSLGTSPADLGGIVHFRYSFGAIKCPAHHLKWLKGWPLFLARENRTRNTVNSTKRDVITLTQKTIVFYGDSIRDFYGARRETIEHYKTATGIDKRCSLPRCIDLTMCCVLT